MAESESGSLLIVLLAVVALIGVGLVLASFASQRSMWDMMGGGGMHRENVTSTATPGGLEWGVLLASAMFFVGAAVLFVRGRPARTPQAVGPTPAAAAHAPLVPAAPMPAPEPAPVPEIALVKLLDDDERRMYLEIREHGGEILQRDLVALGTFSKAKVTRVLDKLERKGLVVRERHGMTNRVRIVAKVAK